MRSLSESQNFLGTKKRCFTTATPPKTISLGHFNGFYQMFFEIWPEEGGGGEGRGVGKGSWRGVGEGSGRKTFLEKPIKVA